jgi:hypothetical protein
MLEIISDPDKLQKYQNQFITQLNSVRTDIIPHCLISWRPENVDVDVYWSLKVNLWWYSRLVSGSKRHGPQPNRWWNVFGIKEPVSLQPLHIDCEINPPTSGINRNIAGAFAEGDNNRVYVVHRGNRWGGGKVGITKKLFWDNYSGRSELAHDKKGITRVAVVAELGNPKLPSDIADFVHWVANLKGSI